MTTKDLIDLSKLTNGRISDRTVFIDFVTISLKSSLVVKYENCAAITLLLISQSL